MGVCVSYVLHTDPPPFSLSLSLTHIDVSLPFFLSTRTVFLVQSIQPTPESGMSQVTDMRQ